MTIECSFQYVPTIVNLKWTDCNSECFTKIEYYNKYKCNILGNILFKYTYNFLVSGVSDLWGGEPNFNVSLGIDTSCSWNCNTQTIIFEMKAQIQQ